VNAWKKKANAEASCGKGWGEEERLEELEEQGLEVA
jgi:hypothetical protein